MKRDLPLLQAYYSSKGRPPGHILRGSLTHLDNAGKPACLGKCGFRTVLSRVDRWGNLQGYPTCDLCQRILKRRKKGGAA